MIRACDVCMEDVNGRVAQGDIYKDIHFIEDVSQDHGVIEVKRILFPYVVVLTQDCDLQQDFGVRWPNPERMPKDQDKRLLSVLVAPLYNAEHFFAGTHLSELRSDGKPIAMQKIKRSGTKGETIESNDFPRYHFLKFADDVQLVDLVVDFKHYFSVNVEYLKRVRPTNYKCKIAELFRENLCLRFGNFLARIGLPDAVEAPSTT